MSDIDRLLRDGTPMAGHALYQALHANAIPAELLDTAGSYWVLVLYLDTGEVWISDTESHTTKPIADHPGWIANFYQEDDEEREHPIPIYEPSGLPYAADTEACVRAVRDWLADHPKD
ncbi:hypothetical protein F4556_005105 [Kitasatospora gansuensis]|uniref:Immunity protein Imm1 n=1 Tax=Kitasatospora gansuensis TaxID=258050 RepID=A0A7W7SFL3_9ACTN|nr:hypothetical protein [Kitasatospora gansuensis]MBB4949570.1 hypothetical protein [Kitasatospora gansuensis]